MLVLARRVLLAIDLRLHSNHAKIQFAHRLAQFVECLLLPFNGGFIPVACTLNGRKLPLLKILKAEIDPAADI